MFLFAYLLEGFYILVYFSFLLDMPGSFLLRAGASVLVVFGLARRVSFVFLVIFYFNNFEWQWCLSLLSQFIGLLGLGM